MSRIIFASFLLLTYFSTSYAQDTSSHNFHILKQQLNKRLTFLERYNFSHNQSFDIEKYSDETAVLLTNFFTINYSDTSYKEFKNLRLTAKMNDSLQIRIYHFGYNCGGTRGWITHPIIQWRDRTGRLHAYNLSKRINSKFYKIYKLNPIKENLYLLIGIEQGNSSTSQNIAYVIKLYDKNISTTYKAFVNRSYINLPNTLLSFDDKSQILKCVNDTDTDNFTVRLNHIKPTKDTTAAKKLLQMFSREYDEPICLKFMGGNFVRQKNCR